MRTSALFGQITWDFLKLMLCPYGQGRGFEPVPTKGEVKSIFHDFAGTSFMNGP